MPLSKASFDSDVNRVRLYLGWWGKAGPRSTAAMDARKRPGEEAPGAGFSGVPRSHVDQIGGRTKLWRRGIGILGPRPITVGSVGEWAMNDTLLLLEGVPPDEISESFLVGVMDLAEESGFMLEGLSILRKDSQNE